MLYDTEKVILFMISSDYDEIRPYNDEEAVLVDFLSSHASLQPLFASLLDRYRVADANEAMRAATAGESIKAVFTME